MISVFTDGACLGNPGKGGWAVKIRYPSQQVKNISGNVEQTTNNRMELTAAIEALEVLQASQEGEDIVLHSDSQYLVRGMNSWTTQWQRRGWRTAAKKPVLNKDLWLRLLTLTENLKPKPQFLWIKGHDGIQDNEEVDQQAQKQAQG